MATQADSEFIRGWNAAEQADYSGSGYSAFTAAAYGAEFQSGYAAFWDARETEIAIAERDCISDYDARTQVQA